MPLQGAGLLASPLMGCMVLLLLIDAVSAHANGTGLAEAR
jgi:hypothetical protein